MTKQEQLTQALNEQESLNAMIESKRSETSQTFSEIENQINEHRSRGEGVYHSESEMDALLLARANIDSVIEKLTQDIQKENEQIAVTKSVSDPVPNPPGKIRRFVTYVKNWVMSFFRTKSKPKAEPPPPSYRTLQEEPVRLREEEAPALIDEGQIPVQEEQIPVEVERVPVEEEPVREISPQEVRMAYNMVKTHLKMLMTNEKGQQYQENDKMFGETLKKINAFEGDRRLSDAGLNHTQYMDIWSDLKNISSNGGFKRNSGNEAVNRFFEILDFFETNSKTIPKPVQKQEESIPVQRQVEEVPVQVEQVPVQKQEEKAPVQEQRQLTTNDVKECREFFSSFREKMKVILTSKFKYSENWKINAVAGAKGYFKAIEAYMNNPKEKPEEDNKEFMSVLSKLKALESSISDHATHKTVVTREAAQRGQRGAYEFFELLDLFKEGLIDMPELYSPEKHHLDKDLGIAARKWTKLENEPLFGKDGPSCDDIVQHPDMGNCFMLAPLASMALQNPEYIKKHIKDNNDGTVTVKLYDDFNGQPTYIKVDKSVPDGSSYKKSFSEGALWVKMFEKAFIAYSIKRNKTNPFDALLEGDSGSKMMNAMRLEVDPPYKTESYKGKSGELFNIIKDAFNNNAIITYGKLTGPYGHNISVVGIDEAPHLLVRDPYGTEEIGILSIKDLTEGKTPYAFSIGKAPVKKNKGGSQ